MQEKLLALEAQRDGLQLLVGELLLENQRLRIKLEKLTETREIGPPTPPHHTSPSPSPSLSPSPSPNSSPSL